MGLGGDALASGYHHFNTWLLALCVSNVRVASLVIFPGGLFALYSKLLSSILPASLCLCFILPRCLGAVCHREAFGCKAGEFNSFVIVILYWVLRNSFLS